MFNKKSDLYAWRSIFQLWVESEIFESHSESTRGERSIDEVERRLTRFADGVVKLGFGDKWSMKRKESRNVLERFLRVNIFLLDLKKAIRSSDYGWNSADTLSACSSSSSPILRLPARS